MNKPYFCQNFFLIDWRHKRLKNTIDLLLFDGEHFYGFSESDCMKYQNFTCFSSVEILWKRTAICPKLCPKCVFSQNFYTWKLGEITLFYVVECRELWFYKTNNWKNTICTFNLLNVIHFSKFDEDLLQSESFVIFIIVVNIFSLSHSVKPFIT